MRCSQNTGCPVCANSSRKRHPVVSVGRVDLAAEWDFKSNIRLPSEVTLRSDYLAGWICSADSAHEPWKARVSGRALGGKGCPACRTANVGKPRKFGSDWACAYVLDSFYIGG